MNCNFADRSVTNYSIPPSLFPSLSNKRRFFDRFLTSGESTSHFLPLVSLFHLPPWLLLPVSCYPPAPSLRCFPSRKAGSSRQPFVTVPYLNCFHGFPFRSIRTTQRPTVALCLSLSPLLLRSALYESKLSLGLFRRSGPGLLMSSLSILSLLPSLFLLLLHILRAPI